MFSEYHPDYVSPPGETLAELMDHDDIAVYDLAEDMNCPVSHLRGILDGTEPIDEEMAVELERQFGVSARFWLARERNYRDWLAEVENAQ